MNSFSQNAQLAFDTIMQKQTDGIPIGLFHIMEHSVIEQLAGSERGSYIKDPNSVYVRMLNNVGVNMVDQYLAENPLSMSETGLESHEMGSTTGGDCIIDGIKISSPEDTAMHMEQYLFPSLEKQIREFDEQAVVLSIKQEMSKKEERLGSDILACGYGHLEFPKLLYTLYGYENYFSCYALYPELMEKLFSLQADYSIKHNQAVVKAYKAYGYPLFMRLDHDMADGRGTLCSIKSLEKYWLDNFRRSIKPALDAGFRMIWHCDGNLMKLIPYLIECGIKGFQGFQYEDGMDYKNICGYKAADGSDLIIMAGVSVTRTLPFGTPDDVAREIRFLVDNGPKSGLFLSTSSTCVPGTPWENIKTMVEGMQYYKNKKR